jgi:hypothetical protein
MFIRWQKRKAYMSRWSRKGNDVHWNVALVESLRVKGKPRQRHVANLCGFTEHQIKTPAHVIYI